MKRTLYKTFEGALKRGMDFLLATLGLFFLSPIILCLFFLIYFKLGRPVLFFQERAGKNGELFNIIKFRSMRDIYDEAGELLPDSERLTAFGLWLRQSSLDELPTLFNVLLGQLSLVGPRPLLSEYLEYYDEYEGRRHTMKPGITGWAQINGRNALTWDEKFAFDIWYIENQSFVLDIKIILLTLKRVFERKDISSPGHATMPSFIAFKEKK